MITGSRSRQSRGTCVLALALSAVLSARPAAAQDMQAYLNETRSMVREGRYQEALERTIWFHHNALTFQPSMVGVRGSFALRDWYRLGQVYAPAMAALVETRDDTLRRLLQNPGERRLFADFLELNRALGDEGRTLEIFDQIASADASLATSHWSLPLASLVLQNRRVDLMRKHGIDALEEFGRWRDFHLRFVEYEPGRDMPDALRARSKQLMDDSFVDQSLLLIQAALALEQLETARTIQTRALEIVPDPRLRSAIP